MASFTFFAIIRKYLVVVKQKVRGRNIFCGHNEPA